MGAAQRPSPNVTFAGQQRADSRGGRAGAFGPCVPRSGCARTAVRLGDRAPTGVPRPARDLHRAGPAHAAGGPGCGARAVCRQSGRARGDPGRAGRRRLRADREQRRRGCAAGARRAARRPASDDRQGGGPAGPVRRDGPPRHHARPGPHGRLAQPRHRPDPQLDRPQPATRGRPREHVDERGGGAGVPRRDRRRRLRADRRRAVRPRDPRRRRRRQPRCRHPLRAPRPARPPARSHRPGPDDAGGHHPEPARLAPGAAHRAGGARHRPHTHRVSPDQGPARGVLVPPRLHGPHRRAGHG